MKCLLSSFDIDSKPIQILYLSQLSLLKYKHFNAYASILYIKSINA